ncbi:glycoside hydrolase family 3 N-terminal domain-containing protein [Pseudokineococcus sp. 5B2Z-1]|uniref:glycoside hydrolase family 3 N-terminal domain-containing protein n=1 Tax=Pseudokineococcus sp. 5B2Z-1 TaxID=3132744 RepID=UPI0030A2D9B3
MDLTRRAALTALASGALGVAAGRGAEEATAVEASLRSADALTLEQQVGQLFAVGVPFGRRSTATAMVDDHRVGTIFWAGRSSAGLRALAADNAAVQRRNTAATTGGVLSFTALDQEGGQVQALRGPGISDIPSALVQGRSSAAVIEERAATWSRQLRQAGFTMNLAPVTDVVPYALRSANAPIGRHDRQFGYTGDSVATATAAWVQGSLSARVQPVLKHFPGLGRVTANTDTTYLVRDTGTPRISATLTPWRAPVLAGAGAVMVSSAIYDLIDPSRQAFRSRVVVSGFLRGDLGFQGVVMTDDVGNAAAVKYVPVGARAVQHIEAGGDLVLTLAPQQVPVMVDAVLSLARRSSTFQGLVRASAARVLALKAREGLA